jgi:hypothetical protein
MKRIALTFPEIGLIGGTRAMFGAGLALLLGPRLSDDQRRAVGWTLLAIGAITTVPIVVQLAQAERFRGGGEELNRTVGGRMGRREYAS